MNGVLVDTCIWSLSLRGEKPKNITIAEKLSQLINDNTVKIIGAIRQEVLSGYSNKNSFDKLRLKLQYFPNETVIDSDYETAAE